MCKVKWWYIPHVDNIGTRQRDIIIKASGQQNVPYKCHYCDSFAVFYRYLINAFVHGYINLDDNVVLLGIGFACGGR